MMRNIAWIWSLFFCQMLLFGISGCHGGRVVVENHRHYEYAKPGPPPWAPAHGYRAKHRYYYYPSSHVYFDIDRGLYFYLSGGHWHAGVSLPSGIHVDVHNHVTLEMDTDKPYHHHSEVVRRYPPGLAKKWDKAHGKGKWK